MQAICIIALHLLQKNAPILRPELVGTRQLLLTSPFLSEVGAAPLRCAPVLQCAPFVLPRHLLLTADPTAMKSSVAGDIQGCGVPISAPLGGHPHRVGEARPAEERQPGFSAPLPFPGRADTLQMEVPSPTC